MNKTEHVLFIISLFIFTLLIGSKWIEEYLGKTYRISAHDQINGKNIKYTKITEGFNNAVQGPVTKSIGDMIHVMQTQKTNNDSFDDHLKRKSKNYVIESFVQRRSKSKDRVNIY